jgi:hypothetical protein
MLDADGFKEKKNRREFHELTRIQKAPAKICAIGNEENKTEENLRYSLIFAFSHLTLRDWAWP